MLLLAGPDVEPEVSALAEVPITKRVVEDQEFLDASWRHGRPRPRGAHGW